MQSTVTTKDIYDFIKSTEAKTNQPVNCKIIRDHFGLNHIRRVTEAVKKLRLDGYAISSDGRGYSLKPLKPNIKKIIKTSDSMIETLIATGGMDAIKHIENTLFKLKKQYINRHEKHIHPLQQSLDLEVTL